MARRKSKAVRSGSVESMTGFGAGSARAGGYRAEVDLRAVNGRYLSLKVRLPGEYAALEEEVRRQLDGELRRGNAEMRAEIYPQGAVGAVRVDPDRVAAYVKNWRALARRLKIAGEMRVESLAAMPEVFAPPRDRSQAAAALPALKKAVEVAVGRLRSMRRREGAALAAGLSRELAAAERLRGRIAARAPRAVAELVERAGRRIEKLLAEAGASSSARPEDLAREAAWLGERSDISEELERLASHAGQFRAALAAGGALGKRLDFLVQEMHREANTIGSKAADTEISALVVELKLRIEKLREQVQNLL